MLHTGTIPYGRQTIDDDDVDAVVRVLRSEWLTTGPAVDALEEAFAAATGAREAIVVSSGTAALHALYHGLGLGPGDEVVVPTLTFAATANAALYTGATPVFADVDERTLLLDPADVERRITPRTRAIVAVDYAGQPCDYRALQAVADAHGVPLVADACHSLGGALDGAPVGSLAYASAFSLHPVKPITSGEGGVVTTDDPDYARRLRRFRNHGIDTDHRQRAASGAWYYEQVELGFNYRLSDIGCALALSQLDKLAAFTARRREVAARYDDAFRGADGVAPLGLVPGAEHAYHLYVVRVPERRDDAFAALRDEGILANVHYVPVHLHPFHRERLGTGPGLCPTAERAYEEILSLPVFPTLDDAGIDRVVSVLLEAVA